MSRVAVPDIARFTAESMIRIRIGTDLSGIEITTNIRVAFRSSALVETSRSTVIRAIRRSHLCGLPLARSMRSVRL